MKILEFIRWYFVFKLLIYYNYNNILIDFENFCYKNEVSLVSYFVFLYDTLDYRNEDSEFWIYLYYYGI